MHHKLNIDGIKIGIDCPVFIIAEAGVNHNGDLELAKQLISKAKECGADCIKFQTFRADKIVTPDAPKAKYQQVNTGVVESQFDMLKKLEMPSSWYPVLIEECRRAGLVFLSTPYDLSDIEFLERFDVPAYKVASALAVEPFFLERLARTGKPILLSTGMCSLAEVVEAVQTLRNAGNDQIVVLQCTTNYPSFSEDCNLRAMQRMGQGLDVLVGYSDHTQGCIAATLSVGLGACVVERHFSLDKMLPGPDHSSSSDPEELALLVNMIREAEKILGSEHKSPCKAELSNREAMRRSIVAACDIKSGTVLDEKHIAFKRPAKGLSPKHYQHVLGRKASSDILKDSFINFRFLV